MKSLVNTRGSILIYAILLANFAVVLAYVVYMNSQELSESAGYNNINSKLSKNIEEQANSAFDYATNLNTNGSGFINLASCPVVSMSGSLSGSTYSENITTSLYFDGTLYTCSGSSASYAGQYLRLDHSPTRTSFSGATFRGAYTPLVGSETLTGVLSDSDTTIVSLASTGLMSGIDINANSDDARPYSTGTIAYPDGHIDDDDLARKTIYGYIRKDSDWRLVYWNNPDTAKYIRNNTNNTGSLAVFPDATSTGNLYLDVNSPFLMRIVYFNSGSFVESKDMRIEGSTDTSYSFGQIGYFKTDNSFSSGTLGAKSFDLANKNFAIFLSGSGTSIEFLRYKLSFTNASGSLVYINPLDDSDLYMLKYLGSDIIVDEE